MASKQEPPVLISTGVMLMSEGQFANALGLSRPFVAGLEAHGAPPAIVLPGKRTEQSETGRGRRMVWLPDFYAWLFRFCEEQGQPIQNKLLIPFTPEPDLLAKLIEQNDLSSTLDDGGER